MNAILEKLGKHIRTDLKYLAHGGGWLTTGQALSALISFFLAAAFANLIPAEVYGSYKFVLSALGMFLIFTLPGMGVAVTQAVAQRGEGSLIPALKEKIKWSFLGSLISAGIAVYFYLKGSPGLSMSFVMLSIFLPWAPSLIVYKAYLGGQKKFKALTSYALILRVISAVSLFIALLLTDRLVFILLTYFVSELIMHAIFFIRTEKNIDKEKAPISKETLQYGKHISYMNSVIKFANQIDKVIIFYFLGPVAVASYSIALAAPSQISSALQNVKVLALPKFSERSSEQIKDSMKRKTTIFSLIAAVVTLIYILFTPYLFLLFPKYQDAIILSQVFSVSLIFMSSALPLAALQAHRKTSFLYLHGIIASALEVVLMLIGVMAYGLLGVVVAKVIAKIVGLILSIVLVDKM